VVLLAELAETHRRYDEALDAHGQTSGHITAMRDARC
jgi:hypothetical protein